MKTRRSRVYISMGLRMVSHISPSIFYRDARDQSFCILYFCLEESELVAMRGCNTRTFSTGVVAGVHEEVSVI
jgi:hypothetical protein